MIKKILPTMIGAALAGGMTVASADITVFGHLDSSVDFTDQDGGYDAQNLNCNTCSLGFKGSEDLGNGLKAIFKLDFQFDMTERNRQDVCQEGCFSHRSNGRYTNNNRYAPTVTTLVTGTAPNAVTSVQQRLHH